MFHFDVDRNATSVFEIHVEDTKGVTASGVTYVVPIQEAGHVTYDAADFTPFTNNDELVLHFIRLGEDRAFTEDDFFMRFHLQFTVNANGIVTVDIVEITSECR